MESLAVGVETTVVGMGVVFCVLIILSFMTWLLSKIVDSAVNRQEAKKQAAVATPAPTAAPTPAPAAPAATGLSAKTVAAIMAAVSLASGKSLAQLRFTAIRRGGTVNDSWSSSGTNEIINTRQTYL